MNIAKLNPWNWLRKEEECAAPGKSCVPARPGDLHTEVMRMLDGFFERGASLFPRSESLAMLSEFKPKLDIAVSDDKYVISVELPGMKEEDIQVELVGDTLIVKGEKKDEHEEKGKDFYRRERSYGSFQRMLALPDDADSADIKAVHKEGLLTLTMLRKAAARPAGKSIKVEKG